ncbi:MAG: hypothetical protein ACTXOO_01580 [Sodalis sp. (in: enterobacteria)]
MAAGHTDQAFQCFPDANDNMRLTRQYRKRGDFVAATTYLKQGA